MQMHTLELVRELEARASTIEDVLSGQFPSLSRLLPSMPPDDIQQRWTGDTGEDLLRLSTYIVNTNITFYERITRRSIRNAKVLDFGCGWGRLLRLMLYTERAWVFRKAGCAPRALGQGAPTRRSGHYGEEAQRRPGVRGACNAAKNPRVLGILRSPRTSCTVVTPGRDR